MSLSTLHQDDIFTFPLQREASRRTSRDLSRPVLVTITKLTDPKPPDSSSAHENGSRSVNIMQPKAEVQHLHQLSVVVSEARPVAEAEQSAGKSETLNLTQNIKLSKQQIVITLNCIQPIEAGLLVWLQTRLLLIKESFMRLLLQPSAIRILIKPGEQLKEPPSCKAQVFAQIS